MKLILRFLILILLIQPLNALGQNKIDSLLYQLKKSKPDSNRVKLLNKISASYLVKTEIDSADFEAVFTYQQRAIALCDSLGLSLAEWKVKSLYLFGGALIRRGRLAEGATIFKEVIKNAHDAGNSKREALSWNNYAEALLVANQINNHKQEILSSYINALNICTATKNQAAEINIRINIGGLYSRTCEYDKAEIELIEAVKKSEAFGSYHLPDIYLLLSSINRYAGNYNKALGYCFRDLKVMKEKNDTALVGDCYGELAELYQALEKPAESVIWYKKCISLRELRPTYPQFALYRTYSLLISQLIKSSAQKEALATIKDLEQRRPPASYAESAVLFQTTAYCYDALNLFDSTEKYYLKTIDTYIKSYKKMDMVDEILLLAQYDIAVFYAKHFQFANARPYLDILVSKSRSLNISTLANTELMLFKADSATGSYFTAIKHFQQYKTLNDSIFNDKKSREIEELQIQYKTEKKDEQIGLLNKKDQLQQANLRQANIIKNWMMASAALLVLLLGVGYNRYRLKQKTNKQLEAQQLVINQKNVSLQRLVNEKEWLMKEIHHRVKNNFHIVMGLLGTQSGYLKNDEAIAAIKESQQRIHAMSLIHQKLYQSESLSSIDMPGYIHELVDYLKESFDKSDRIQFHFQVHRISLELSHVIPIGLILNEAITNVFKYAFPVKKEGNIYLSFLYTNGNQITLTVKDDGAGLPADFNNNGGSSMGLNLMRGLSEDIDGCFTIQSNNGTIVTVSFAYNPEIPRDVATPITG